MWGDGSLQAEYLDSYRFCAPIDDDSISPTLSYHQTSPQFSEGVAEMIPGVVFLLFIELQKVFVFIHMVSASLFGFRLFLHHFLSMLSDIYESIIFATKLFTVLWSCGWNDSRCRFVLFIDFQKAFVFIHMVSASLFDFRLFHFHFLCMWSDIYESTIFAMLFYIFLITFGCTHVSKIYSRICIGTSFPLHPFLEDSAVLDEDSRVHLLEWRERNYSAWLAHCVNDFTETVLYQCSLPGSIAKTIFISIPKAQILLNHDVWNVVFLSKRWCFLLSFQFTFFSILMLDVLLNHLVLICDALQIFVMKCVSWLFLY